MTIHVVIIFHNKHLGARLSITIDAPFHHVALNRRRTAISDQQFEQEPVSESSRARPLVKNEAVNNP